jgi:hypothetical protein
MKQSIITRGLSALSLLKILFIGFLFGMFPLVIGFGVLSARKEKSHWPQRGSRCLFVRTLNCSKDKALNFRKEKASASAAH